jgi:hypothetical protein
LPVFLKFINFFQNKIGNEYLPILPLGGLQKILIGSELG